MESVLITGANRGIGLELSNTLRRGRQSRTCMLPRTDARRRVVGTREIAQGPDDPRLSMSLTESLSPRSQKTSARRRSIS